MENLGELETSPDSRIASEPEQTTTISERRFEPMLEEATRLNELIHERRAAQPAGRLDDIAKEVIAEQETFSFEYHGATIYFGPLIALGKRMFEKSENPAAFAYWQKHLEGLETALRSFPYYEKTDFTKLTERIEEYAASHPDIVQRLDIADVHDLDLSQLIALASEITNASLIYDDEAASFLDYGRDSTLPIDQLFVRGKGVCQEYARANKVVFDTIKLMQADPERLAGAHMFMVGAGGLNEALDTSNHGFNQVISLRSDGNLEAAIVDPLWAQEPHPADSTAAALERLDYFYTRIVIGLEAFYPSEKYRTEFFLSSLGQDLRDLLREWAARSPTSALRLGATLSFIAGQFGAYNLANGIMSMSPNERPDPRAMESAKIFFFELADQVMEQPLDPLERATLLAKYVDTAFRSLQQDKSQPHGSESQTESLDDASHEKLIGLLHQLTNLAFGTKWTEVSAFHQIHLKRTLYKILTDFTADATGSKLFPKGKHLSEYTPEMLTLIASVVAIIGRPRPPLSTDQVASPIMEQIRLLKIKVSEAISESGEAGMLPALKILLESLNHAVVNQQNSEVT